MSITDDSTSLNTTWTEQPVVAFTAGTLSTYASLVTEIEGKLQRGTLTTTTTPSTTQLQIWIVRAKQELMEAYGFTFSRRFATATATSGSYRFALPPDYGGGSGILRDTTNDVTISAATDRATFDAAYPDVSSRGAGQIEAFTIKNNELWLSRPADGATLELEYNRTGDDNTATTISYIPERLRWKLVDLVCIEAFELLQEFDKASYYQAKGVGRIQQAKRGDSHKKWAATGYRAKPWFS
jgi:hypothetical protein